MTQDETRYPTRDEIEQWMLEAKNGNAEAQYQLGICYANGYGVTIDRKLAVKHFCNAAEQGHAEAQYQLGICHFHGYGVPTNQSLAVTHWERAAKQGLAKAQYQLGNCHYHGNGVYEDHEQAKQWYAKAGEQGHADALYGLSLCSIDEESFAWCKKAAEMGNAEAQFHMGIYYDSKDAWVVIPSYNKARYWHAKAAEQGHFDAQCCLEELDEEREQTEQWIHEAEAGDPEALCSLAECYEYGIGIEHDYHLAKEYYTRAHEAMEEGDNVDDFFRERDYKEKMEYLDLLIQVDRWEEMAEQGNTKAMLLLAKYYEYDGKYEEDLKPKRAIYWLHRAVERGDALAQVSLGTHYELGNGVFPCPNEAFRIYSLAAEQGDTWGQYELGHCHEQGIGVEKDMREAIRWYALSASQGGIDARNALHRIKDWYSFPEHKNPEYAALANEEIFKLKN